MKTNNEDIRDFWDKNPCGEKLVEEENSAADSLREFFLAYDQFRYRSEKHIPDQLKKIQLKGKKVLEIGIGQGADAQKIAEEGGIYHGVDFSPEAIRRVRERFNIFNLLCGEIREGTALSIPFQDAFFNVVYSHGVLHHIPDVEKAIKEIHRVLRPQGKLVVMLYCRKSLNYYISILFLRRILLLGLLMIDVVTFGKVIKNPVLRGHINNVHKMGLLKYMSSANFLSHNTDGPDNPYSTVYTPEKVAATFKGFHLERSEQFFLNERQLPALKILPQAWKKKLESRWGWHLWCVLQKD